MKYFVSILLCLCIGSIKAQTISNINFDEIKKDLTSPGPNNYATLLGRIKAKDTTLTPDNYKHLYYGQVFQASYSPYGDKIKADAGMKLLATKDLAGAEKIIDSCLAANPVNMDALYYKAFLAFQRGGKAEMVFYALVFKGLLACIMTSGDGHTDATAMVVTSVPDEYQVLKLLKAKVVSQTLTSSQCDRMVFERPGSPGQGTIYFNVEKPLASLTKGMK